MRPSITTPELKALWRVEKRAFGTICNAVGLTPDFYAAPDGDHYYYSTIDALHQRCRAHPKAAIPTLAELLAPGQAGDAFVTVAEVAELKAHTITKVWDMLKAGEIAAIQLAQHLRIPRPAYLAYQEMLQSVDTVTAAEAARIIGLSVGKLEQAVLNPATALAWGGIPGKRPYEVSRASLMTHLAWLYDEQLLVNCTPDEWLAMRRAHPNEPLLTSARVRKQYGVGVTITNRLTAPGGLPCLFTPKHARIPRHVIELWHASRQLPVTAEDIGRAMHMNLWEAVQFSINLSGAFKQ